ncbi:hypothetical protein ABES02_28540 [Neobacillus pocheonensis]|uniref:hypothetical protein n=1 Tax=Neobacillus pocheonensis TaxID=363869 RepID=UPI003D2CE11D
MKATDYNVFVTVLQNLGQSFETVGRTVVTKGLVYFFDGSESLIKVEKEALECAESA